MQTQYPHHIGDVRILGAMIAMELVRDGDDRRPNPELTAAIVTEAARKGLILLSCGIRENVIRILPPLTITDALVDESMGLLDKTLEVLISSKN